MAAALELLGQPLGWLLPASVTGGAASQLDLLSGNADPGRTCEATVAFGQALVGLLPVVMAAQYVQQEPQRRAADGGRRLQAPKWLARSWAACNAALRWAARVNPRSGMFILWARVFCAVLWQLCKLLV